MCCTLNRRWTIIPINNSDTAWLVVSDYNQDNGKYYEELREDIISPDIDQWHYQPQWMTDNPNVGDNYIGSVGDYHNIVFHHGSWIGGSDPEDRRIKSLVGGHDPN